MLTVPDGCHADDEGENDRTGITKRFYVPSDLVTSDLALPAAKEAAQTRSACPPHDQLYL
jgi:3-oxoacyl-[acyl-carrier-protein] synthase III